MIHICDEYSIKLPAYKIYAYASYIMVSSHFVSSELRWEVIVSFVDNGGIV